MNRVVKWVLVVNLLVLAVLTFAYPHLMVSPGKLIVGHRQLDTDCFACHSSFSGVASERCTSCHKPDDIGRLDTKGKAVLKPLTTTAFHQKLTKQDCVACHSDHAGVKRFKTSGRFSHALLQADVREQCEGCHRSPTDSLHKQITGNCAQCHSQEKWTPATFSHDKFFTLDREHNAPCLTCHLRSDYSQYTCYGCHEHTPEKIRREHIEEGIRDFRNCVECHRSADEHDIRMPGGGRREHD